ncbi:glycosyltransferase family 2 protein [Flavobacterium sp. W21_SRS_FM6]|uniref:glycosyltransferase family 2 protein n=1 Tax=Flavobacterium sp. W21_SRS_FM6 TaxID=3240268 RepID=UPI003F8E6D35
MKVSIITVCFNSSATIRDTIESVLAQDYQDIEYIVVDGGSKDSTMDIVNEYRDQIATIVSEPDKGIYDAMNKGIRLASGDVVGILNSDDFYTSNESVSQIVSGFDESTQAVYADLIYVKQNDTSKFSRLYTSATFSRWKVRFGFMVPHPTFYARRELFERLGFYKLDYRVAADFELMARFFKAGITTNRVNSIIVSMREGGISSSGIKWRIHQNMEISRACNENGIWTAFPILIIKIPFKFLSFFKKPKTINDSLHD